MGSAFNLTNLGDIVGYKILSLESMISAFEDLNVRWKHANKSDIQNDIEILSLDSLMGLISPENSNYNLIESVCSCLDTYFSSLDPMFFLNDDFNIYIIQGLNSSHDVVRNLSLNQIMRPDIVNHLTENQGIIYAVLDNMESDIGVYKKASFIFEKWCSQDENFYKFFNDQEILSKIKLYLDDPVTHIRVLELLFDLLFKSGVTSFKLRYDLLHSKGLSHYLVPDLKTLESDLLLRLNYIELCSQKIEYPCFQSFILNSDIFPSMMKMLKHSTLEEIHELDPTLLTSDLLFLSKAAVLSNDKNVPFIHLTIDLIYDLLGDDVSLDYKLSSLKSIAILGSDIDTLCIIDQKDHLIHRIAKTFISLVGDPKVIGLDCLTSIFNSKKSQSSTVYPVYEKLYDLLQENLNLPYDILHLTSNPDIGLKTSAYGLLISFTKHSFTIDGFINDSKTLPYLLDRKNESDYHGNELKYQLIKEILNNSNGLLNPLTESEIKNYLRLGVIYKPMETHVELSADN